MRWLGREGLRGGVLERKGAQGSSKRRDDTAESASISRTPSAHPSIVRRENRPTFAAPLLEARLEYSIRARQTSFIEA